MKKHIVFGLIAIFLLAGLAAAQQNSIGPSHETTCEENICTTMIYSYEKYWLNEQEQWEEIDESFYDCSTNSETKFCTRQYHFNATADNRGDVTAFLNNNNMRFRISGLLNHQLDLGSPSIEGSVVTYNLVPNYIDLRYQYLPKKLKEEIVIKRPLPNLPERDFNISFTRTGNADFVIPDSTICDRRGACVIIPHWIEENKITLEIPVRFLNHPNITYPVFIDPTIELNDSDITWNGMVIKDSMLGMCGTPPCYVRQGNPAVLKLGSQYGGKSRGDIDWDISSVSSDAEIYNVTLVVYIEDTTLPDNVTMSNYLYIKDMEKNSSDYANQQDNCSGNCQFYNDMGNGTIFADDTSLDINFTNFTFNSEGIDDFTNALSVGSFSTGLHSDYTKILEISGRDNTNATRRPKMIVVWGVNGTDSGAAIEEGINNAIPDNPIRNDQQVYIVNENGEHYLETFDKTTVYGDQSWLFNYVLPDESFLNVPSVFDIVNVWENMSLSYSEIVNQVETFINDTIY
ncbi:MAG: hypothetical protein ABH864_03680 [archaeon]